MLLSRLTALCFSAVLFLAISVSSWAQFETRSRTLIPSDPLGFAVADFNHDGTLDIAIGTVTGKVAILLGRGDGTFSAPTYYVLDTANDIAAGDFNGDGNVDIAVADRLGQNISILLGNGDGTFQPPVAFSVNSQPTYLTVGDFNNDGNLDVVVCNSPYVSVLLGNGDGTLQAPQDNNVSFCSAAAGSVATGNFNGDRNLDVVFVGSEAGVLLGNGDGTFQPAAYYPAGIAPQSVTVADFDRNGSADFAVADIYGGKIWIFLGDGTGSFQPGTNYTESFPASVFAADLNSDGIPDLIFLTDVQNSPIEQITVMFGRGDATFQPATTYQTLTAGVFISVGDFNSDHKTDIVYSDEVGPDIGILLNTGVVSFSPNMPLSFPFQPVNSTSNPLNVKVTNTGKAALSIAGTRISGPFRLGSQTTCGSSVKAHGNCTLSVQFRPSAIGTVNGLLTLSDSASSKAQVIELTGVGTIVKVQPGKLNFGTLKVGTRSDPQTVTVTNVGSTLLNITSITFTGSDHTEYSDTNTCGKQLGPSANCTISVTFAPLLKGTRVAMLQITDDGGASPQLVQLTGVGD